MNIRGDACRKHGIHFTHWLSVRYRLLSSPSVLLVSDKNNTWCGVSPPSLSRKAAGVHVPGNAAEIVGCSQEARRQFRQQS